MIVWLKQSGGGGGGGAGPDCGGLAATIRVMENGLGVRKVRPCDPGEGRWRSRQRRDRLGSTGQHRRVHTLLRNHGYQFSTNTWYVASGGERKD